MSKVEKILLFLSIVTCIFLFYYLLRNTKENIQTPIYSNKIDSLESEISNIKIKRDSVKRQIDTTVIKIKENEKYYKEIVDTIINNNVNEDYIFFVNYLKWNRERYDSINNIKPTERN